MINDFVPKKQKVKCPKCGKTKIVTFGCVNPFEFCKKCGVRMEPCQMNLFDKLLGRHL